MGGALGALWVVAHLHVLIGDPWVIQTRAESEGRVNLVASQGSAGSAEISLRPVVRADRRWSLGTWDIRYGPQVYLRSVTGFGSPLVLHQAMTRLNLRPNERWQLSADANLTAGSFDYTRSTELVATPSDAAAAPGSADLLPTAPEARTLRYVGGGAGMYAAYSFSRRDTLGFYGRVHGMEALASVDRNALSTSGRAVFPAQLLLSAGGAWQHTISPRAHAQAGLRVWRSSLERGAVHRGVEPMLRWRYAWTRQRDIELRGGAMVALSSEPTEAVFLSVYPQATLRVAQRLSLARSMRLELRGQGGVSAYLNPGGGLLEPRRVISVGWTASFGERWSLRSDASWFRTLGWGYRPLLVGANRDFATVDAVLNYRTGDGLQVRVGSLGLMSFAGAPTRDLRLDVLLTVGLAWVWTSGS